MDSKFISLPGLAVLTFLYLMLTGYSGQGYQLPDLKKTSAAPPADSVVERAADINSGSASSSPANLTLLQRITTKVVWIYLFILV